MKNGIVAAVVAVGALFVPASPAVAEHCSHPFFQPNPFRDPVGYIEYEIDVVRYAICQLTHR